MWPGEKHQKIDTASRKKEEKRTAMEQEKGRTGNNNSIRTREQKNEQ